MNSTEPIQRRSGGVKRLMLWPILGVCLAAALSRALAADPYYINNAIVTYPGTEAYPPVIDAVNFVNNGQFEINFSTESLTAQLYETSDTLNYTNGDNGLLEANTGFIFDNQSANSGKRTPSANFINSGQITCGLFTDVNSILLLFGLGLLSDSQCFVNATNIVNPGAIDIGVDGLLQMTGKNIDLSYGTLFMAGNGANVSGSGVAGLLNTNFWDPSLSLTPTTADSAFIAGFGFLDLPDSTPYTATQTIGATNQTIAAVFIEDFSGSNVTYNVYFDRNLNTVTVEWISSYLDPATGQMLQNYLYLTNNFILGASTNAAIGFNGIPDNFGFGASPTPAVGLPAPAPVGFNAAFTQGTVTNFYSFADAQFVSTTATTNSVVNGAITNLPGRFQITANQELNLAFSYISGVNYMWLQSTNQFDGSPGANIQVPFSDINLGVTNGFLTITNLMAPQVPNWSGVVAAWTTRWIAPDQTLGVTNLTDDYRVLIVGSQLVPTTPSQVQDLTLHGANLVISDALNVTRKLSVDARSLTLTTNLLGYGATSVDGELNLGSSLVFSTNAFPNMRNLTNGGAIRTLNQANFGNPFSAIPEQGLAATGGLSRASALVTNVNTADSVTIGTNFYQFVSTLTNAVPNQIQMGTNFDASLSNLVAAINLTTGLGTAYSSATKANPWVRAGGVTNHGFTVTAFVPGVSGNSVHTLVSSTNLTWGGYITLQGGMPAPGVPYDNFINYSWLSDQGSVIYASNFVNGGTISNGVNSFSLQSITAVLTNASVLAAGDIAITANTMATSNLLLVAGRSLTLRVTNLLSDGVLPGATGLTNANIWSVQSTNGSGGNGILLPIKPAAGDLLGTTISNYAAGPNHLVLNQWAGQDRGISVAGYSNNAAVGRLVLDAIGATSVFKFTAPGVSNALYVDELVFLDKATNGVGNSYDFSQSLSIGTNMMIYFAQALADGVSIAQKIDTASLAGRNNGGRLRWVPQYVGYFSSQAIVYPDGSTNVFNAALAGSNLDSDGDGIPNASDPTPFFVASQLHFGLMPTNLPPQKMAISWNSIPSATNYVYYRTNLAVGTWQVLTNFVSPATTPPAGGWPITNLLYDSMTNQSRFYQLRVDPAN